MKQLLAHILAVMFTFNFGVASLTAAQALTADDIEWTITNRFSPFEAHGGDATFERYKMIPDATGTQESTRMWHERLWLRDGSDFISPYAGGIVTKAGHWNADKERHQNSILKYIKNEDADGTTIGVEFTLTAAKNAACAWDIGPKNTQTVPCEHALKTRIPLKGIWVAVRVDGGADIVRFVKPRHMVIVAMGDSYGSGEGNPDIPAKWATQKGNTPITVDRRPVNADGQLGKKIALDDKTYNIQEGSTDWLLRTRFLERGSQWLDNRCHRSFFSYQSLSALSIASQDPHLFVSFLHYACSGAEVFDGLLTRQEDPTTFDGKNAHSQIDLATRELCLGTVREHPFETMITDRYPLEQFLRKNQAASTRNASCRGALRSPDLVFLSIGGNDIGFADILRYFLVPVTFAIPDTAKILLPDICPSPNNQYSKTRHKAPYKHCKKKPYDAGTLTLGRANKGGIQKKLKFTLAVLEQSLKIKPEQIIMAHYPDPLRDTPTGTRASFDPCAPANPSLWTRYGAPAGEATPWDGLRAAAPTLFTSSFRFNLTKGESLLVLRQFNILRREMLKFADSTGVTFVCETQDAFAGAGWAEGSYWSLPSVADKATDAELWHPSQWDPYRGQSDLPLRAVRTPNDSLLTQAGGHVQNTTKRFMFHGTAHPNLVGHSLVADRILSAPQFQKHVERPAQPQITMAKE